MAIAPEGMRSWLSDAVVAGGGEVVGVDEADVLVWTDPAAPTELGEVLAGPARHVRWVQLPWAGVEPYREVIAAHPERIWTCGKGVYAEPVAEHALAMLLAGLRGIVNYARQPSWSEPRGTNLLGAPVTVVGGGGIAESLLRLLAPFGCDVTVVRRHPAAMRGASQVVGPDDLDGALRGAIGVVLCVALTPETDGLLDRRRLELVDERGWVVNVARGRHIVTDDLVEVLCAGGIGGAALDVTDPEPLPDDHPLWSLPNALVTPHIANTPEMAEPLLSARITENIRRARDGEPLLGPVDPALGY